MLSILPTGLWIERTAPSCLYSAGCPVGSQILIGVVGCLLNFIWVNAFVLSRTLGCWNSFGGQICAICNSIGF